VKKLPIDFLRSLNLADFHYLGNPAILIPYLTTRDLHRSASIRPTGTVGRIQLEQPEMVGVLGLQRAHQSLKSC
jgi:hypothetical protein